LERPVKSIVVVGGGSAGWLAAGGIAARHKSATSEGLSVTLVESPNIPIIGVGEGTWPTMRSTLLAMGISETDFIRECDAAFKQGAKFARWVDGSASDYYYHPLVLPQGFPDMDLAPYWWRDGASTGPSFAEAVCTQAAICEQGLAPKLITTGEYDAVANYAYHLDAGKFSAFLQRHCTEKLGVRHILDDVIGVETTENGDIASVTGRETGAITGDLFVDCTGFRSLLLGEKLGVAFIDRSDTLFIDTALAVQVPYPDEQSPIASHTISTAQSAGWIWDIGLPTRRGVGHVYSSRHTTEDAALRELETYVGKDAFRTLSPRKIPITSGHREKFWSGNCVAVGLSAGFLEPLEASALVLIELSVNLICDLMPADRAIMDVVAQRFNRITRYRWDRIIDFLKLHYILSQRDDSDFWRDNRRAETIPDSLAEQLAIWRHRPPSDSDFESNNEVFPAASYLYVLYGMRFTTDFERISYLNTAQASAESHFVRNKELKAQMLQKLPSNRDLLNRIRDYGLQAV
jgi:tryptophan 7-halogenase